MPECGRGAKERCMGCAKDVGKAGGEKGTEYKYGQCWQREQTPRAMWLDMPIVGGDIGGLNGSSHLHRTRRKRCCLIGITGWRAHLIADPHRLKSSGCAQLSPVSSGAFFQVRGQHS